MSKQISILGTGWLGLPLAKAFLENNYTIKGSTTSENKLKNLSENGIIAYQIVVTEEGPLGNVHSFFSESDTLIINIPPGVRRNPEVNFVAKIEKLIPYIENSMIKKVIFVSSTSVFADLEGFPLISEEMLPNASSNAGKQLIEVEQLLQNQKKIKTTVLRFAGLFGPNRHPATMLSKRNNIKNPEAPVNLIHLTDCIGIIKKIIETKSWGHIFNASYPDHPEKAMYYTKVCEEMGLPAPDYDFDTPSKGKIIDSKQIVESLNYKFMHKL